MTMPKEKVLELAKKHNVTIMTVDDAEHAFWFVWELLCAEYDALKESEPYATNTLSRLEHAEHEVYDLMDEVTNALYDCNY